MFLAKESDSPKYRIWEERHSEKYGIIATDPAAGRWLAVAPFCTDRILLEQFICFLDQKQAPLEDFQDLFLGSGLLETI